VIAPGPERRYKIQGDHYLPAIDGDGKLLNSMWIRQDEAFDGSLGMEIHSNTNHQHTSVLIRPERDYDQTLMNFTTGGSWLTPILPLLHGTGLASVLEDLDDWKVIEPISDDGILSIWYPASTVGGTPDLKKTSCIIKIDLKMG